MVRQRPPLLRWVSLAWAFCLLTAVPAEAGFTALQTINGSSQSSDTTLTAVNTTFTTNFKGTNDVVVTLLSGSIGANFNDAYPSSPPGNSAAYLSAFVGSVAGGTGNGAPGVLRQMQSSITGTSLQFTFGVPLDSGDRFVVSDTDNSEQITIQAFTKSGASFTPVSLAGWTHESFTGQTGILPNAQWAAWNPTGGGATVGALTGTASALNEPLDVFTVNQPIDRIVITQLAGGNGTIGVQFLTPTESTALTAPEPASATLLGLGGLGVAALARLRRRRA